MIELIALVVFMVVVVCMRGGQSRASARIPRDSGSVVRGLFTYVGAFVGLLATLYAASGLLAIGVGLPLLHGSQLMSASDLRTRLSFTLAALIVGLPLWVVLWGVAQRRVARVPEEREVLERRLFLAALFVYSSITALLALQALLGYLLALPGPLTARPSPIDALGAASHLVVYGLAWLLYARLGWSERSPRHPDEAHDLAVYLLAVTALTVLAIGAVEALRDLGNTLTQLGRPALISGVGTSTWIIWAAIGASLLAGGTVWAAIWRYDLTRAGERALRVAYLYLVLIVAVPLALATAIDTLYETLRRLLGYHDLVNAWGVLTTPLSLMLVGGTVWAYHWAVLRRSSVPPVADAIVPACRPALALLSALGLATTVSATVSLLWLPLDALLGTGAALSGDDWWRDRLCVSVAAAVVGLAAWLPCWRRLQRAAGVDPEREGVTLARRLLVTGVALLAALSALGFAVVALWLLLRTLLGQTLDASTVSDGLKDLSAVIVLAALAAYHALILRRDLRLTRRQPHREPARLSVLLAPGAEATLAALGTLPGLHLAVIGHLQPAAVGPLRDLATLRADLTDYATNAPEQRGGDALLIVAPDGGLLYPYTLQGTEPAPLAVTTPHAATIVAGAPAIQP